MSDVDGWHVAEGDLRDYARGELAVPLLWSADAHLTGCAHCRGVLAELSDPAALDAGWERLDAELDAPRPGWFEGLLVRCGVGDGTARLLAATPVLRRSWFGAVAAVLVTTFLVAFSAGAVERPALFLALAPLLPLAGVAVAYGPVMDPTYEMAVVAPVHGFRLLMIRTVAVLVVALGVNGLASLAMPGYGLTALAWLLPGLALTTAGLALTPRLGPVGGPVAVAAVWVALLVLASAERGADAPLAPFTAAGQGVSAGLVLVGAGFLFVFRDRFDVLGRGAV
ncbi:zf-HC2 domain-containing protein [Streptomyces sp. BPPL-273]|uniref:Zf-HC2 domain-containing protein n=1 Tax=Streptomyces parvulus TaxID=146923 RepID=A0ABV5DL16_9ACTN|nr:MULTISPECIES: zf-HC2 domain-containing protein [Streptomyces]MCQ4197202.1 zf-HC2 domain-containing protein [Streptomyces parvulus]WHM32139.1 zf-HC2 domain-containing protein [Streptomyces sp. BPPL-273]